jgi:chromosome partitioning protein
MPARIIVIPNHKGGTGKTTTAISVASSAALRGFRVLIVDFDPQGQAATALGLPQENGVFNLLVGASTNPFQWIRRTGRENLDILPGDRTTASAQVVINAENRPIDAIKTAVRKLAKAYDYIVFDTAPSVGGIQERAIYAASLVIIPTATEFLSLDGLAKMTTTLGALREVHRWEGRLIGILPTFYDEQTRESRESMTQLQDAFPERILSPIHRATILRECAAEGKTVFEMNPQHRAAREYEALATLAVRKS